MFDNDPKENSQTLIIPYKYSPQMSFANHKKRNSVPILESRAHIQFP